MKLNLPTFLLFAILIIVAVLLMPLALVWSINTLFELHIPYTLETWAASLIISSVFGASGVKRKG